MSFTLKSHSGRHKMFIGSIACLLITALGISSHFAVRSVDDHDEAVKLLHSGLDLLADGKIEDGFRKLESANSKSPHICQQMTNSWDCNGQSWNSDNLAPELALKRLDGIKILRSDEQWVDEERIRLLDQLSKTESIIDIKEKRLNPWSSNVTSVPGLTDPRPADAELASLLWAQNRKAEAVAKIDRAVALYPWNQETRELAQKIYKDQKQFSKLQLLEKRNLDDSEQTKMSSAYCSYSDEAKKSNLELLNKLLTTHPWCATALIIRSSIYLETQRPQKAIDDANKILSLYPGLAEGYYRRAKAYETLNEPKKALDDYEAALKTMPYSSDLIAQVSAQALSLKLNDKVLQAKDKAIKLAPRNLELLKEEAKFLQSIGRLKDAEKVADEAIPLARLKQRSQRLLAYGDYDSYNTDAATNTLVEMQKLKAEMRISQNDPDGAIKILDAQIAESPKNLSLRELKTDYLFNAKKFDLALASINDTIAHDEQPPITIPIISQFNVNNRVEDYGSSLTELPPGGQISYDTEKHLEKRADIYAALKDHANELKDRSALLQLRRLHLNVSDDSSTYMILLADAINLPDRAVAHKVADRLIQKSDEKEVVVLQDNVEYFCFCIEKTKNPALAVEILTQLENGLDRKFVELSERKAALQARI